MTTRTGRQKTTSCTLSAPDRYPSSTSLKTVPTGWPASAIKGLVEAVQLIECRSPVQVWRLRCRVPGGETGMAVRSTDLRSTAVPRPQRWQLRTATSDPGPRLGLLVPKRDEREGRVTA